MNGRERIMIEGFSRRKKKRKWRWNRRVWIYRYWLWGFWWFTIIESIWMITSIRRWIFNWTRFKNTETLLWNFLSESLLKNWWNKNRNIL